MPIIISSSKSSIAGYSISSIYLGIRCISSINKTSPGSKLERIAAKSPGFSIDGPDAVFKSLPNSFAIICASVVFPKPGGPYNNTWSNTSSLILHALINTLMFSFTSVCPTYSSKYSGLILFSKLSVSNFSSVIILSSI